MSGRSTRDTEGAQAARAPNSGSTLSRTTAAFAGTLFWGLSMMIAAGVAVYLQNRLETGRLPSILFIYFAGGALAWLPARVIAGFLGRSAGVETRFAAHFLCLTIFTVGFTTLIFALDYRAFYAQWHAPVFTYIWFLQQFFTLAGASYQFAVIGLRLFLPLGLPLLVLTSVWLSRRRG